MNKWLTLFLQLVPVIVTGIEKIGTHLAGHEKKAAAEDALVAIAQGVGSVAPQHAEAATIAATTANNAIDGVVALLNETGTLNPHKAVTQ